MNPRYQPGGDLYAAIQEQFGTAAANAAAAAARVDDDGRTLRFTLSNIRSGNYAVGSATPGASTLGNFWTQITTDPLAAPLDTANAQLGKAVWNVFKNPWVLLSVAAAVFYAVGGFTWLRKNL